MIVLQWLFWLALLTGLFVVTCERARMHPERGHGVALFQGALLALYGVTVMVVAMWGFSVRCDETCNEEPGGAAQTTHWSATQDAWQWPAQLGLAAVGMAAVLLALASAAKRKYRAATVYAIGAALLFTTWLLMVEPLR